VSTLRYRRGDRRKDTCECECTLIQEQYTPQSVHQDAKAQFYFVAELNNGNKKILQLSSLSKLKFPRKYHWGGGESADERQRKYIRFQNGIVDDFVNVRASNKEPTRKSFTIHFDRVSKKTKVM